MMKLHYYMSLAKDDLVHRRYTGRAGNVRYSHSISGTFYCRSSVKLEHAGSLDIVHVYCTSRVARVDVCDRVAGL